MDFSILVLLAVLGYFVYLHRQQDAHIQSLRQHQLALLDRFLKKERVPVLDVSSAPSVPPTVVQVPADTGMSPDEFEQDYLMEEVEVAMYGDEGLGVAGWLNTHPNATEEEKSAAINNFTRQARIKFQDAYKVHTQ